MDAEDILPKLGFCGLLRMFWHLRHADELLTRRGHLYCSCGTKLY